ncbi:hypothetical protein [Nocardia tengchongensis]|uniref:hypothetical protein n=1 Tax=Nocardia tengchongensis TaxID=2055889 RepID=UPI003687196D
MAATQAVARVANSEAVTPAAPTRAAPWKNPPNIAYIDESSAKSHSAAMPASDPKYSADPSNSRVGRCAWNTVADPL